MYLIVVIAVSCLVLALAYRIYGGFLASALKLDAGTVTPAVSMRDDVDYLPIEPRFLMSQHFSAIAAAGPIVGPILAGAMFGWAPALLWIIVGSIFIGGVHDFTALVASIRHRARSIAEVVREHMSRRAYVLFLAFVWFALIYIVVAFTDITASSFVGVVELENGQQVSGSGIATSSLLYLIIPVAMGLLLRFTKMGLTTATIIFLPLVAVSIWAGQRIPLDAAAILGSSPAAAQRVWGILLLVYCFVASLLPMWLLLQPRGHLGGYFLYFALIGGGLGLILGGEKVNFPAFTSWTSASGQPLFPMLFILIACGACSGFHSIVASGTTCKQLRRETDARVIGYGAMLLEALVAVISLCCVMRVSPDSPLLQGQGGPRPNYLYAAGIGSFLSALGVPPSFGVSFGLMAFTTFVYDTLDVCTRLGRYVLEELLNFRGRFGRMISTALTAGVPLYFLLDQPTDGQGRIVPVWRVYWDLFGASNQLLAALTLIGVTVWLWKTRKARWVWAVTGLPTIWMYAMSMWALARIVSTQFATKGATADPVAWVGVALIVLAVFMLIEAARLLTRPSSSPPSTPSIVALTPS